jgi:hypothetical protein
MMLRLRDDQVAELREMYRTGTSPSGLCRHLLKQRAAQDINDLFDAFIQAFGVKQSDVSCLGGWWVDGNAELSDRAIDGFIAPAIERARHQWQRGSDREQ